MCVVIFVLYIVEFDSHARKLFNSMVAKYNCSEYVCLLCSLVLYFKRLPRYRAVSYGSFILKHTLKKILIRLYRRTHRVTGHSSLVRLCLIIKILSGAQYELCFCYHNWNDNCVWHSDWLDKSAGRYKRVHNKHIDKQFSQSTPQIVIKWVIFGLFISLTLSHERFCFEFAFSVVTLSVQGA